MTSTSTIRNRRGFFGTVFLIIFWLFQALMVWTLFINVGAGSDVVADCANQEYSGACATGAVIGSGIVAAMGWMVGLLGTIILGLFAVLTRGSRETVITHNSK